ncbi:uncharacterized protein BDZ99DRAFT_514314 [Mytilinidion resinicola]|uniref:Uncharacterized protein n=1 Tax=Mytilinidion resinicola TaxID=574789 RepID=A0A6A6Z4J2_9PEZI|nr:uncharacterized protein BDZ99DRAFT_514314 [Mytilinidion resinicola]KAF2815659.1 hypothetical protein BDZ99DRAFT_514314 [Mytilinidion resinicola]
MPPKRSAPSSSTVPAKPSKRARLGLDITEDALEEMDKQELISHILKLQCHIASTANETPWKPSCKTKSAKFSYEATVTDPAIFHKLFKMPAGWKKKQLQYSPEEFAEVTRCYIEASIRYGTLSI